VYHHHDRRIHAPLGDRQDLTGRLPSRLRRLFAVAAWHDAPFFTERERAALALTDAVTRLGEHGVPDEVWAPAAEEFTEQELADLLMAIATINVWNRLSIAVRNQPPLEV
jgi:alkylhydroperoxidase family enzyme